MMDRAPIGTRASERTPLRPELLGNGDQPVPIVGPDWPGKGDWRNRCAAATEDDIRFWETAEPGSTKTSLLTGRIAHWPNGSPLHVPATDVPVITPQAAVPFEDAAGAILWVTGVKQPGTKPSARLGVPGGRRHG
jgi:hypothetical protein